MVGRTTDDGSTATYTELYYRCHRILAEVFHSDDGVARTLSLPGRKVVLDDVRRHVTPRSVADSSDRGRLHLLPGFLYRSAPESQSVHEMKEVGQLSLASLRGR